MTRWPLLTFPAILDLDGLRFQKVPSRPGAVAEYEEVRGSKRLFVVWRNERFFYNYDEKKQTFGGIKL